MVKSAASIPDFKARSIPAASGLQARSGDLLFNAPGFEIVDAPELKRIFILNIAGPHSWRVVYTTASPSVQRQPAADFLGHSIGHWDGDTLVIYTVGFNEKQWIVGAYPTTRRLHLTERFSRPNLKTLNYEAMIDDPGAYTQPWSCTGASIKRQVHRGSPAARCSSTSARMRTRKAGIESGSVTVLEANENFALVEAFSGGEFEPGAEFLSSGRIWICAMGSKPR